MEEYMICSNKIKYSFLSLNKNQSFCDKLTLQLQRGNYHSRQCFYQTRFASIVIESFEDLIQM